MNGARPFVLLILLLATILPCLFGCAEQPKPASFDANVARDALTRFLDTWKRAGTPKDLQTGSPSIIVGEPDWESGGKLSKYEILKDRERQDGVNLHATVQLTIQSAKGKKQQTEVTYIVGTNPVITIHRK